MPNFREQLRLSAVVSAGMYLGMCRYCGRQPALRELLACEGIGIAAASLPIFLSRLPIPTTVRQGIVSHSALV
jgi:hypothetical protein